MWYRIEFFVFRICLWLAELLPLSCSCWLARRIGNIVFLLWRERRKIALANMNRAFGSSLTNQEKKEIARRSFAHTAVSILEVFLIPQTLSKVKARFQSRGFEHLESAVSQGRGIVLVISHVGSWEYMMFLHFLTAIHCSTVVKKLKNPYINEKVEACRKMTRVNPIEKENSMRRVMSELKRNHLVAILIDQWDGPDGIWVDFFGEATSTTSIPARLAKQTDCVLLPAFCLRQRTGFYEIKIMPEVPLQGDEKTWERDTTEKLNRILEDQIRKCPEQWNWGHRRWKPRPSAHRVV